LISAKANPESPAQAGVSPPAGGKTTLRKELKLREEFEMKNKVFLMAAFSLVLLVGGMGNVFAAPQTYEVRLEEADLLENGSGREITALYKSRLTLIADGPIVELIARTKFGDEERVICNIYDRAGGVYQRNGKNYSGTGIYHTGDFRGRQSIQADFFVDDNTHLTIVFIFFFSKNLYEEL
jgi:hypothetical protein